MPPVVTGGIATRYRLITSAKTTGPLHSDMLAGGYASTPSIYSIEGAGRVINRRQEPGTSQRRPQVEHAARQTYNMHSAWSYSGVSKRTGHNHACITMAKSKTLGLVLS